MRPRHALLTLPLVLLAGCAGAAATPAQPACRQPAEAVLPHTAGTLAETDSGAFCLAVGEQISVFLTAQQGRWSTVTSSDPALLAPTGTSALTAPVGVTPGLFRGAGTGTVRLSSRDGAGRAWQVTVVLN